MAEKNNTAKQNPTGKGKRAGFPKFYIIYFASIIVVVLAVAAALGYVRRLLTEYEAAQPKYVAARVFEEYFDPIDYDRVFAGYDADEKIRGKIVDYLKEEIGDSKLTYSIGSSNDESEVRYNVKVGQTQLASIVLTASEQKTKHGFDLYDFSGIDLDLNVELLAPEFNVTIKVPAGYSVFVDGEAVLPENRVSAYTSTDFMKFYPSDVPGIAYEVYSAVTVGELPGSVTAFDPQGAEAAIMDYDEDTYTYTFGLAYNEDLEEEYSEFVIKALEEYAAYVQAEEDTGIASVKGYFDADSAAYADVVKAGGNRWMVVDWSGIDFQNETAGEFYAHTPEIFSCRVSFTQVLHRTGREDYVDVIDKYLFLHQTKNGYKIYEWYNAS